MFYVYILRSAKKDWMYIGSTVDLKRRFKEHNSEKVLSTKHYAPFTLEDYVAVKTEKKARALEKYFKTGSGNSILKKRILD